MSSPAEGLQPWWRAAGRRPVVLAHRGARHAAPENTMAAFELAYREGADGVELDVRLDRDGEVIVLHDPTLERVTAGAEVRHVEDIPSGELSRLDVGFGERVPRLSDVLRWARERGQRVNVELKSDLRSRSSLLRQVARVVRETPLPTLLFSSFHPQMVWWLAKTLKDLPRAWLVNDQQTLLKYTPGARLLGVSALHPQHTLATPTRVRRAHDAGLVLNVWTVNDSARARELADLGVDGLISDVPGQILQALGG